jgi:hypothetical protein
VGNILGKRGVRSGLDLDPLLADEGGKLELGARAMTVANGAARARTGQNGVAQRHVTFLSRLKVS